MVVVGRTRPRSMSMDSNDDSISSDSEDRGEEGILQADQERKSRRPDISLFRRYYLNSLTPAHPRGLWSVLGERSTLSDFPAGNVGLEPNQMEDVRPRIEVPAPTPSNSALPSPGESRVEPPRAIGLPVTSEQMARFLALDPVEGFDIQTLNGLRLNSLAQEAAADLKFLRHLALRAEALILRVKQELDDPLSAGEFLREQVLLWYRQSPEDATWKTRVPRRWAGIFADSRTSGSALQPWINVRLWNLREEAVRLGGLTLRLRQTIVRSRDVQDALSRFPAQLAQAEVAQSILDDLATHPRSGDGPLPLVRLSELAMRRQVSTVNEALGRLFSSPEGGPFGLLHPNRYPDCEEVIIRPPAWGAAGVALAYTVVLIKPRLRTNGGAPTAGDPAGATGEGAGNGASDDFDLDELAQGKIWELETVDDKVWRRMIEGSRREKRRLFAPPKDFRTRAAYVTLRKLLLESAELRTYFLAVKWRGRPGGLPLVTALLMKGSISPEVVTDAEYLDAELSDLAKGDPGWIPEDGTWTFSGWKVTREGNHRDGFRYKAEPDGNRAG